MVFGVASAGGIEFLSHCAVILFEHKGKYSDWWGKSGAFTEGVKIYNFIDQFMFGINLKVVELALIF